MQVPFTKMNSQGNDFVVIDNTKLLYEFNSKQVRSICSRKVIGCDQLLLLNVKDLGNVTCEIFNQDGTSAQQCGNGMRAIMLFLNREYDYNYCDIFVNRMSYRVQYLSSKSIAVDMGVATFVENIPSSVFKGISISMKNFYYNVLVKNGTQSWSFSYSHLSIGNPHCIVFSNNSFNYKEEISTILNSIYDDGVNISFILNIEEFLKTEGATLRLRVNERGSGWTKSCGSGATAAGVFALRLLTLREHGRRYYYEVNIEQEGGNLKVHKSQMGEPHTFTLYGPSTFEYDGAWND